MTKSELKFVFSASVFCLTPKKDFVRYLLNNTENMRWVGKRDEDSLQKLDQVSQGNTLLTLVDSEQRSEPHTLPTYICMLPSFVMGYLLFKVAFNVSAAFSNGLP